MSDRESRREQDVERVAKATKVIMASYMADKSAAAYVAQALDDAGLLAALDAMRTRTHDCRQSLAPSQKHRCCVSDGMPQCSGFATSFVNDLRGRC